MIHYHWRTKSYNLRTKSCTNSRMIHYHWRTKSYMNYYTMSSRMTSLRMMNYMNYYMSLRMMNYMNYYMSLRMMNYNC